MARKRASRSCNSRCRMRFTTRNSIPASPWISKIPGHNVRINVDNHSNRLLGLEIVRQNSSRGPVSGISGSPYLTQYWFPVFFCSDMLSAIFTRLSSPIVHGIADCDSPRRSSSSIAPRLVRLPIATTTGPFKIFRNSRVLMLHCCRRGRCLLPNLY